MKHSFIRFIALLLVFLLFSSAAFAYEKLQRGDINSNVLSMQRALNQIGYSVKADGNFGSGTLEAVKDFQQKHGLKVDGIAGDQTLTLLYSLAAGETNAPAVTQTPAPVSYSRLEKGDSGSQVLAMQQALNKLGYAIKADGKFGDSTKTAVKSFQNKHGLKVDGIAGTQTLTLLYSLANNATVAPTATNAPTIVPVPSVSPSYTTLRKGDSGAQVLLMQQALIKVGYSIAADGKFGAGTQSAVKSFQSAHGLGVDGAAGTQTLTLLYQLANAKEDPTPVPATPVPGGLTAVVTTTGGTLNLRSKQSSNATVIDKIPNQTTLSVTSRGATWCAVIYNGKSGYVMTSFLKFADAPTPTPTPVPVPTASPSSSVYAIVTTTGGTLNFRASASKSSKVLTTIPNASTLLITSRGSEWCAAVYNGQSGYVMTSFLTFLSPQPTATSAPSEPTQPPQQDPSVYSRTLRSGMTGDDVTWVQTRLKALGYTVNVNGTYDSATIAAVKSFQTHNCLTSDGLAGSQTFAVLASDSARKASDAIPSYTTLRIDDTGSGVTSLQNALIKLSYPLKATGTYDIDTHNAVVAFQQRNGLVISGIADGLTLTVLYGGGGKPYSTAVQPLDENAGKMAAPSTSEIKMMHWYDEVKPTIKAGQTVLIYDPATGLSWNIQFYSLGHHADSEPKTWRDTQIMNRSFKNTSWTVHPVYVKLPSGQWTMATMHNRPHLYGSITDNGFGGHLCIHFLRDISECISAGDKDYGVQNQRTLRSAWKALTGETIPDN